MFVDDLRWHSPANTIVCGPSFSGKTSLVDKIIRRKNVLIKDGEKKKIILYYLTDQDIYKKWDNDKLLAFKAKGVPDIDTFRETINFHGKTGAIVIFDDLGADIKANAKFFRELFLVLTHHMNLNVYLLLHNIFPEGLRELSLNTHRFVITYNPRDSLGISTLSRQCFPGSRNFLTSVYKHVGKTKYGYLILDFHQETNPVLRVTSNWFGEFGRNYIMAFQETGACSTTPYKCLNIISTELYNSLLEKSKCCDHDDDGNSAAASASANSSPSFQNNFYPQNNLFPSEFNRSLDGPSDGYDRPDDEDGPGGGQKPQLVETSPDRAPTTATSEQTNTSYSDEPNPQHHTNADGASSINEPTNDVSSNPNIATNDDDKEKLKDSFGFNVNDTSKSMFKDRLQKKFVNTKPYQSTRVKPSISQNFPKKEEHMNTPQLPVQPPHTPFDPIYSPSYQSIPSPQVNPPITETVSKKEETTDVPQPPSASHYPPPSSSAPFNRTFVPSEDGPRLSKAVSKIKDEVKWNPPPQGSKIKKNDKFNREKKKPKPEPKKREFKVERHLPRIEDDPDVHMDNVHIDPNANMDTTIEHIPIHDNNDVIKFHGSVHPNILKSRKYPKITKNESNTDRVTTNDTITRKLSDLVSTKKSRGNIRVRKDLYDKVPEKTIIKSKPKIRVRTDLFEARPEKSVLNKSSLRGNNSRKKNINKIKVPIPVIEKPEAKSLREKRQEETAKNVREFFAKNNKEEIAKNVRNFFVKNKQANIPKYKASSMKKSQIKRERKYKNQNMYTSSSAASLDDTIDMVDANEMKIEKKYEPPKLKKSASSKSINEVEMYEPPKLKKSDSSKSINEVEMYETPNETGARRKQQSSNSNKRAIKKEKIEKGSDTKLSHTIKREMLDEEMRKRSKKQVNFQGSKRKNKFPTHPTGPIKFVKKKHRGKDAEDEDDKKNFKKKFSGSGFSMWRIKI